MTRQLAIISALTAISQLSAFLKLWFTARVFGIGADLDGYNLALVLPTMISGVIAGCLQTGLFPVRAKLLNQTSNETVVQFERSVLWAIILAGIIVSIAIFISSPLIAHEISAGTTADTTQAVMLSLPILSSLIALNVVGDSTGYLLAMRHRFAYAAAAPILNGLIGATILAVWPETGLAGLIWGTVLGLAAQVAVCMTALRLSGFRLRGPTMGFREITPQLRDMFSLGMWILPGVLFANLSASLPPLWIATFGEGANSAFGYAYRLHSSLVQLFVMASSPIILANFSELVAAGNASALRKIIRNAAMASMLIGIAGTAIVGTIGGSALQLLFSGRFDADAATRVAHHWSWLSAGLAFALLGNVFSKLWQAQQRAPLMSAYAGLALGVLFISQSFLERPLGELSVAAAITISASFTVIFGFPNLRIKGHKMTN